MRKKLQRFPKQGYLGGVCHGMGEHTGIDPIQRSLLMMMTKLVD
jgi:phage shock protein PspC (stress-responsive transcriptional regulator)